MMVLLSQAHHVRWAYSTLSPKTLNPPQPRDTSPAVRRVRRRGSPPPLQAGSSRAWVVLVHPDAERGSSPVRGPVEGPVPGPPGRRPSQEAPRALGPIAQPGLLSVCEG
jgi:hypothetical protein